MMRYIATACSLVVLCGRFAHAESPKPEQPVTFERHVRPILKAMCFECHGDEPDLQAGLDLRLVRLMLKGGETGAALVPGKASESLLIQRLAAEEMPPGKKKLTAAQLATIRRWIDGGAKTAREEPADVAHVSQFTPDEQAFWSFQPIRRPEVPAVQHAERVRTPIDAFLLARLEAQQLSFAADAEKRVLLRRACFDLTGLPPTLEESDLFLADDAPDAYERLIDRLLASPHYGERWGRHWLDVAGYADSEGYTAEDVERKHAWRYRDYVIRSLNADKPWNEFIVEQLAGDELLAPPYNNLSPAEAEKLAATGFLRMAPDGTAVKSVDARAAANQVVADTLKIVSSSLLGLTVGCAQCHNHRYDPIPQQDYYRLRAIFEPAYNWQDWRAPAARLISLSTAADRKRAAEIEAEAAKLDSARKAREAELIDATFAKELAKLPEELHEPIRAARETPVAKQSAEQKQLLKDHPSTNVSAGSLYLYDKKAADELKKMADEAAAVRAKKPAEGFVHALTEVPGKLPATHLFARGDHDQPKQAVTPGELAVLAVHKPPTIAEKDPARPTSGRRLAYAQWLTSGQHPLTARVLVNRVWMHHFGRGIVGTPADFGRLGQEPTHPALLDWLADDFMAGGWRLKRLHKTMMLSTAYRQSSTSDAAQDQADPDNLLLGRKSLVRLDAEAVRDALLAVSGKLNAKMFGPPVPVMADEVGQFVVGIENLNAGRPQGVIPLKGEEFRRSVYVQVRRSKPLSMLSTFDAPLMEPNCEERDVSTVAPQALLMMNNDFVVEQSSHFARRVRQEAGEDIKAQIRLAWRLTFNREPSEAEIQSASMFLGEQASQAPKAPAVTKTEKAAAPSDPQHTALADLCHALLSANEFLYVE